MFSTGATRVGLRQSFLVITFLLAMITRMTK
jgi:hypothetical protein